MSSREMEWYLAADRSPALGPALRQAVQEARPGELDRARERIAADLVALYSTDPEPALEAVVCLGHRCPQVVTAEVRTAALTAWAQRVPRPTGADWDSLSGALGPETFLVTLIELIRTGRCVPSEWFWSAVLERLSDDSAPAGTEHGSSIRAHLRTLVAVRADTAAAPSVTDVRRGDALVTDAHWFVLAGEPERARSAITEACDLDPTPARELHRLALELITDPEQDLCNAFAELDRSDPLVATWSALAAWCAGEPGPAAAELREILLTARGGAPAGLRSASRMLLAVLDGDASRIAAAARAALLRAGDGWSRDLPVGADVVLAAVADVDEPLLCRLLAGTDPATIRPEVRVHVAGALITAARRSGTPDRGRRLALARTLLEAS